MTKLLLCAALLLPICTHSGSAANISVYHDYASWLNALESAHADASVATETFDSGFLSTPGLSFTTRSGAAGTEPGLGQIQNGQWTDQVGKNAPAAYDTTQISFSGELFGIGGDWNVSSSAAGLQLWLNTATSPYLSVSPDQSGPWGSSAFTGWWGILSDEPFSNILIGSDTGSVSYTLDNLSLGDPPVSNAPEPQSAALAGLALGAAGLLRRRLLRRERRQLLH